MLEVSDLVAGYGEVEVLHGVSININEHEIVALLGSNGAGKSTLNNNICGIYPPRSGRISFLDQDITHARSEDIVALGVIQIPEGRRVFPNITVRENLELGGYRRARRNRAANLEKMLTLFPRLEERLKQLAGTLSGGEQQMLAIARGMMAEPRVLILDEPSLGLSPVLVQEMFELLQNLHAQGLAILLVEQNVMQSLEIADRAYVLENGNIVMQGEAAALMQDDNLRRAYLGL